MLFILSKYIPHLGPHTIKVRLKNQSTVSQATHKSIYAVSFSGSCGSSWEIMEFVCIYIHAQRSINFVFMCVPKYKSIRYVPAGLTTGADDYVPLSLQFPLSLSFIYYFIYNPSTANSFRPMGALNIFGRFQKKCV